MFKLSTLMVTLALGSALSLAACKKDEAKTEAPKNEPTPAADTPAADTPAADTSAADTGTPSTDDTFAQAVMKPYEICRALLAADKSEGVSGCADAIAKAARTVQAAAPEAARAALGEVAVAAEALAKAAADDIEALRLSFGELSKPVVAMLTAAPEAAKHYHLFECPMAKGYQRWAQPGDKLNNPYMGAKMLECGSEIHDHHQAKSDHGDHAHGEAADHQH